MRVCLIIIAIFFVAMSAVSSAAIEEREETDQSHVIQKRDTIFVKPPGPGCIFYECIPRCKQRGYKRGGICTINGCQCLH